MDFEVLGATLGIDVSGWDTGFDRAEGTLGRFSAETTRQLAQTAESAGMSLDKVAQSAEQLSEVLGVEMGEAAALLDSALKNPTAGLEALSAAGIDFTAAQREAVASLMEADQGLSAHGVVLDQISDRYEQMAASIDDLNARRHEYANIPDGGSRGFLDRTNSEDSGGGLGGLLGSAAQIKGGGGIPGLKMPSISGGALKAGAVAGAMLYVAKEGLQEFAEAEKIHTRLEAVIRATGEASGFTADQLREMEDELVATTAYTGDSIAEAQIFLTTLKQIKGDRFEEVMNAGADLAAVMGTDITPAVELLGRALIDPEQGMARLRRAGIVLNDAQQDQVKSFLKVNDVAAAQKVILDEISSRTAGAAAAAAETLSGKWDRLWESVANVTEVIGEKLAPVAEFVVDIFRGGVWVLDKFIHPLDTVNSIFHGLYENLLKVRIAWNDFWGDVEESNRLKAELDVMQKPAAGEKPVGAAPAAVRAGGGVAHGNGKRGGGMIPDSELTPEQRRTRDYVRTDDEEREQSAKIGLKQGEFARRAAAAQTRFADDSHNRQTLRAATPGQAKEMMGGLRSEADDFIGMADGMGPNSLSEGSLTRTDALKNLMATYRASAEQMKGFNATLWKQMEAQATEAMEMAAGTSGEIREFHLENLRTALDTASKMFDNVQTKEDKWLEELEKKSDAAAEEEEKKAFLRGQGLLKDEDDQPKGGKKQGMTHGNAVAGIGKKGAAAAGPDEFGAMQDASKNQLQAQLAEMIKQFQGSNSSNAILGIGTPEQRKGLIELQEQYLEVMRNVRDSTGDARAANIEELRVIQDAWAKAQQAIRDGSKKTVEQLVEDAKKQGKAGKDAADGVKQANQKQKPQTGQVGDASFAAIGGMSRGLSNMFSGALGGAAGGAMAVAEKFSEVMEAARTPLEKLALEIQAVSARVGVMSINVDNFHTGTEALKAAQNELLALQKQRQEIVKKQMDERLRLEKKHEEEWGKRQMDREEQERERQREEMLNVVALVGKNSNQVIQNYYGVTDKKQFVDDLDREMKRRGKDVSGLGRLGRST